MEPTSGGGGAAKSRVSAKRSSNSRSGGSRSKVQKTSGKTSSNRRRKSASASEDEFAADYTTRCICGLTHNDEFMICCDKCEVWQHMDCMGIDRANVPSEYFCEQCQPRQTNAKRASEIQRRKLEEMANESSDEMSVDDGVADDLKRRRSSTSGRTVAATGAGANGGAVSRKRSNSSAASRKRRDAKPAKHVTDDAASLEDSGSAHSDEDLMAWEDSSDNPFNAAYVYVTRNNYDGFVAGDGPQEGHELDPSHAAAAEAVGNYEASRSADEPLAEGPSSGAFGGSDGLPHVAIAPVEAKGSRGARQRRGLFAEEDIESGRLVVDFRGKVLRPADLERSLAEVDGKLLANKPYPFALFLQRANVCVDGTSFGSEARFVRRSCTPNAEARDFVVDGKVHVGIFAQLDIPRGDEVTVAFDYAFEDKHYPIECACPLDSCLVKESNERRRQSGMFDGSRPRKRARTDDGGEGHVDNGHPNGQPAGESKRRKEQRRRKSLSPAGDAESSAAPTDDAHAHGLDAQGLPFKTPAPSARKLSRQHSLSHEDAAAILAGTPAAAPRGRSGSSSAPQQAADTEHVDERFLSREERKLQAILRQIEKMENPQQTTPATVRKEAVATAAAVPSSRKRGASASERDLSPSRKRARSQPQTPLVDRDVSRDDLGPDTISRQQRNSRRPSTGSIPRSAVTENGHASSSSSSSSESSDSSSDESESDAKDEPPKQDLSGADVPKFGKKALVREWTADATVDVKPVVVAVKSEPAAAEEPVAAPLGKKAWLRDWQPSAEVPPPVVPAAPAVKEEETAAVIGGKYALKRKVLSTFYGGDGAAGSPPPASATSASASQTLSSESVESTDAAQGHTHAAHHPRPLDLSAAKEVAPSTPLQCVEPPKAAASGEPAPAAATTTAVPEAAPSEPLVTAAAGVAAQAAVDPVTPTKRKVSLGDYLKRRTSTSVARAADAPGAPTTPTDGNPPPVTPQPQAQSGPVPPGSAASAPQAPAPSSTAGAPPTQATASEKLSSESGGSLLPTPAAPQPSLLPAPQKHAEAPPADRASAPAGEFRQGPPSTGSYSGGYSSGPRPFAAQPPSFGSGGSGGAPGGGGGSSFYDRAPVPSPGFRDRWQPQGPPPPRGGWPEGNRGADQRSRDARYGGPPPAGWEGHGGYRDDRGHGGSHAQAQWEARGPPPADGGDGGVPMEIDQDDGQAGKGAILFARNNPPSNGVGAAGPAGRVGMFPPPVAKPPHAEWAGYRH